jgi:hypothetical protein
MSIALLMGLNGVHIAARSHLGSKSLASTSLQPRLDEQSGASPTRLPLPLPLAQKPAYAGCGCTCGQKLKIITSAPVLISGLSLRYQ